MGQINLFTNKEEEKIYSSHSTWAKLVKTRDGKKCVNQEKYPERNHELFDLNAHHLHPKKHLGKNILSNGITYCRACHAAEHAEYQQKFTNVFRLQVTLIRDFIVKIFGISSELQYYRVLEFLTGETSFRPHQKQIIKAIVEDKKHVFAVMPTGSGKSLLYQIPGIINQNNPSLIISPLKALQIDQVSQLNSRWIPATYINSSLSKSEIDERIRCIKENLFPFVFIHPKQLLEYNEQDQEINIKYHKPLSSVQFDYMVVDEVHVIKNQGLSFIKEYYHLDEIYKLYDEPQMILLTATASKKTREFIIDKLGLDKENVLEFVSGFKRPEITLQVYPTNKYDKQEQRYITKDDSLFGLLENKPEGKTIIFAVTTGQVDSLYDLLRYKGFKVVRYHSKLSGDEQEFSLKSFTGQIPEDQIEIMVATSAFGMGIDIPDIHQIIHYSLPFSLTDYYQQFGRAGRDGNPSVAQLLYDEKETTGMVDFINKKTIENERNDKIRELLRLSFEEEKEALMEYVNAYDKWQYILDYFGEPKKSGILGYIAWFILLIIMTLVIYALVV